MIDDLRIDDPQPAASKRRWLLPTLVAGGLVVLVVVAGGLWLALRPASAPASDVKAAVVAACHDAAVQRLRSPSTAQFSADQANLMSDGHWHATGVVDGQNGFGAMIRNRWACDATGSGATWTTEVSFTDWP